MLRSVSIIIISCSLPIIVHATDRFIVKYKPTTTQKIELSGNSEMAKVARLEMARPLTQNKMSILTSFAGGATIKEIDQVATGAHVILLDRNLDEIQTKNFINGVQTQSDIAYIEEDRLLKSVSNTDTVIMSNPNWQWDMNDTGEFISQPGWNGNDFNDAWALLSKAGFGVGKNVVIGVVDTGYTPHPNILSALIPTATSGVYGYQFISDCRISGQCAPSTPSASARGYPYQINALDLGDFVSASDINDSGGFFVSDCSRETSTWHGTHITGTLVANGYSLTNPDYIAGGAYNSRVLPVRVLGKCGGYVSDIVNGVMWASGFDVINNGTLIPANVDPAQVINLSIGGPGACDSTEQDAIDSVSNAGVVVVVAAGNNGGDIKNYNPSGCNNVVVVAAKGPTNNLAYYSNYGATTIAAAGGDSMVSSCYQDNNGNFNCPSLIYSTVWSSPHGFQSLASGGAPGFAFYSGTSMATPHVAAAIADIIGVLKAKNQSYTLYGIISVLQQTAKTYNSCNAYGCADSGDLDTEAAIEYVMQNNTLPSEPVQAASPPATSGGTSGGGGGGGCSAITNGDDYSLILLLIGSMLYALKNIKTVKGWLNEFHEREQE